MRQLRRLPAPCVRVFHSPLAEQLQARAVDHQVDRPTPRGDVQRDAELGGPLRQRAVVRDLEFQPEHRRQRAAEAFGLAVGELQKLPQRQQALDRRVAERKGRPTFEASLACSHAAIASSLNHSVMSPRRTSDSLYFFQFVIFSVVLDIVHLRKTSKGIQFLAELRGK